MEKQYYNPEIWGGIECTINRVKNQFFDQLTYSNHYNRPEDIQHIAGLGIKKIRYPILWEKHQPSINSIIDWTWVEGSLDQLREKGIDIIAGLVHHGSGPAFTSMSDEQFPYLLADYARLVAEKFPWINYYTPVNEPLTTARFSGLYGLWYPHRQNTNEFLVMLLNELKGTVLSMMEIRKINPEAKLVQTEDLGKTYSTPKLRYQAGFENERRWLTFDILCGRFTKEHKLWNFFIKSGIPEHKLNFFIENPCPPDIFGFNHYLTSERYLDERLELYPQHSHGGNGKHRYADVEAVRVDLDEETGIEVLLNEAWERFKKPIVVTEVHLHCHREEQLRWFKHVWEAAKSLISKGVDIRAITSWAMLGSYGWNKLLTQPGGDYEPGVFDLRGGAPRPTALASFIKEINKRNDCDHLLVKEKGWWQRNNRFLYGSVIRNMHSVSAHNSKPVVIIGKNGTLGKAFAKVCFDRCIPYIIVSRQDVDISNRMQVDKLLETYKPWAVINAAGFVRVDDAEKDRASCIRDNVTGPENLSMACGAAGIQLISFSSDLVFDGNKNKPYTESDLLNPLNIYGESKAMAEHIILNNHPDALVVRTSAFFSPWDIYNFVYHVRKSLAQDERIKVAKDLIISPTYVPDLVNTALDLLIDKESGIWHLANTGALSWADFALIIADEFELDSSMIEKVSASELNYMAKRPAYSVLSSEKGHFLPPLENAIERYVHEEKMEKRKVA